LHLFVVFLFFACGGTGGNQEEPTGSSPEIYLCHLEPQTIMNGDDLTLSVQYGDEDGDVTTVCVQLCCNEAEYCSQILCDDENGKRFDGTFDQVTFLEFPTLGYCLDSSKQTLYLRLIDSVGNDSDVASCSVNLTNTTDTCASHSTNDGNVKLYFASSDCSGSPYTYKPSTQSCTTYTTLYSDSTGYLQTTNVKVKLLTPSVVHAGTTDCVTEEAISDLWLAEWVDAPIPVYTNVKIYFPTDDCSGQPYTYAPLTDTDTIYSTLYEDAPSQLLMTSSTEVNLYIPTVVHAGTTTCATEGASYDLYEAAWHTPVATYPGPITIEAR